MQSRNAARDPSGVISTDGKSGAAGTEGAIKAPDRSGRSAGPAGPTTSKLHNNRVKDAADGGVPQVLVEEPLSDTAAVGKRKKTHSLPQAVAAEPVPKASPTQSQSRKPKTSMSMPESKHPPVSSAPVSSLD